MVPLNPVLMTEMLGPTLDPAPAQALWPDEALATLALDSTTFELPFVVPPPLILAVPLEPVLARPEPTQSQPPATGVDAVDWLASMSTQSDWQARVSEAVEPANVARAAFPIRQAPGAAEPPVLAPAVALALAPAPVVPGADVQERAPQVRVGSTPVIAVSMSQAGLATPTVAMLPASTAEAAAAVAGSVTTQGTVLAKAAPTVEARWGEQMLHTLRQSVEVQVQQRVQHATIRLDPPSLGSLEVFVSHDTGRLEVRITAGQAEVARQLHGTLERLRQDLLEQSYQQVTVLAQTDSQGRHSSRHSGGHSQDPPIPAVVTEQAPDTPEQTASDVLVTA